MKFRNVCPNGARTIPALNDVEVAAGAVVDVLDEAVAAGMVDQPDVWQIVDDKPARPAKEAVK